MITKVTATRIETADKRQFMRKSGKLVGDSGLFVDHLHIWNEVSVDEARKRNAEWLAENGARLRRNAVSATNWHSVSDKKIIRIKAILDEKENE